MMDEIVEQATQTINRLESEADEYGEHRLAHFTEQDAEILRKAVELAWQYIENSK